MFKAKKALGQNFISDPQIIEAIVDACGAGPMDTVVEIGPGKGALTCELAERAARVIAVELDTSVIPLLKGNLAGAENVEVINEDRLKFDWSRAAAASRPQAGEARAAALRVIGNLPYYITTSDLRFRCFRARRRRPGWAWSLAGQECAPSRDGWHPSNPCCEPSCGG